jgi:hypothetical protein
VRDAARKCSRGFGRALGPSYRRSVAELSRYLGRLVDRIAVVLGADLIGVYLHGSAAMDAFVPSRSDVDILVVVKSPLSQASKASLGEALSKPALPDPGVGLELSVLTAESAVTPSDAPRFELHVNTVGGRVVDGATHGGDPDLVAHFAMVRARGQALIGPPPDRVFANPERGMILSSFVNDLEWALENKAGAYGVLNSCRVLRFAREGGLYSKLEGGEWALESGIGDAHVISAALRRQRGSDEVVDVDAAAQLVEAVRAEVGKVVE